MQAAAKTAAALVCDVLHNSAHDGVVVLNDPFMFTYRRIIVDAANRFRLPSIYGFREFVDDGGMIS